MSKEQGNVDMSIIFRTGDFCKKTSWYICKDHPYVEKWVVEGDTFPKCSKVNCGNTEWLRFSKM